MARISGVKYASSSVNSRWNTEESKDNQWDVSPENIGHEYDISCQWDSFRSQILTQWPRLTQQEVDTAGPNRGYLACLISMKYQIEQRIIRNYLTNLERHLPLML